MSGPDAAFLSVAALAAKLAGREFSARELAEASLARIDRLNHRCKAFITVTAESALAAAERADRSRARGAATSPLNGIPFASKDLIDIAGVKTTAGSRVLADNVAGSNAFLIDRMLARGAVSLGKLNLHEFAYGGTGENPIFGTPVNAYDTTRIAGGSSSGSAAACAFGLVPAAFGTDTGGSVRAPAALNGLVGVKPTLGRISIRGVLPYCWSLDHVGIMTRTVGDAALLLQAVAGFDPLDPASADVPVDDYAAGLGEPLAGLRVGVPARFYFEHCDAEILAACEAVLRRLERGGAALVTIDLPPMTLARAVSLTLQMPEALSFHAPYLADRGSLYGRDFRAGLALGQCLLAEHYVQARRMLAQYRRQTDAVFETVDVIVTPTTPLIAPELGAVRVATAGLDEAVGNAITRYTTFFNLSGHPAVTVPCGLHSRGLPMGVQVVGRYFAEALMLRVAAEIEADDAFALPAPSL
jgi:aspartyl-tRNA(Asn)/glutamyl-tRNA(Gln) amidotransferase subunit A